MCIYIYTSIQKTFILYPFYIGSEFIMSSCPTAPRLALLNLHGDGGGWINIELDSAGKVVLHISCGPPTPEYYNKCTIIL